MKLNKLISTAAVLATLMTSQASIAGILSLSDDSSAVQNIGFNFGFFGNTYSQVFVGSNGYLTFGSGDNDFSESVSELLNDQARIAIWDDFNPSAGGTVSTTSSASQFTASYNLVPQFGNNDANTFDISIFSDGSIELAFGSLATSDLLVGISAGGGTTGTAVDLSQNGGVWGNDQTIYQQFSGGIDLANSTVSFGLVTVSEPANIALFGLGLAGLGFARRKKA